MTIRLGEHPDTDPVDATGHNKFLGNAGEGHRGVLLARHADQRRAIVLAKTSSLNPEDGVRWGRLYLIEERNPGQWPRMVDRVSEVPWPAEDYEWEIVVPRPYGAEESAP